MKIGDAGAPSALLRPGPGAGQATSFVSTFGSVQRAFRAQRPAPLYEVSDRQARRREFELVRQRLEDAARVLEKTAPQAEFTTERRSEIEGVDRIRSNREITTQEEVTRPARPATQTSIAFESASEILFKQGTKLEVKPGNGPKIKVSVETDGASLQDIADAVNGAKRNGGRVLAEVLSDGDGFRLRLSTTQTGSDASLEVTRDSFKPLPKGKSFSAIDPALATPGEDESTETVTTTETIEGSRRVVRTREVETRQQVDDVAFRERVQEFVAAYDALRSFVDEENLDMGDEAGLLGNDERVRSLASALSELDAGLDSRVSESGVALSELGIQRDAEGGGLRFDAATLDDALARDATAVVELLNSSEGGLGADVAEAITPPGPDPSAALQELRSGLTGYLESLGERERQLEAEADLLELVVDGLSEPQERGATPA